MSTEIAFAQSFDVYCEKPGKLKKQFKKVEYTSVKNLKISGSLNEKDFEYLQQFINLETLDLSKATIPPTIYLYTMSNLKVIKVSSDCEITSKQLDELHVFDGHEVSLKNGHVIRLFVYKGDNYSPYSVNRAYTYYKQSNEVRFEEWNNNYGITKITPESVKNHRILKYFYDVTVFKQRAFWEANITEIQLPDKVKVLGEDCFYKCYSLKKIIIPSIISVIDKGNFNYCNNLEELNVHAHRVNGSIGTGCKKLEKVTLIADIGTAEIDFYECGAKDITIGAPNIILNDVGYAIRKNKINLIDGVKILDIGDIEIDTLVLPNSLEKLNLLSYIDVDVLVIQNKSMELTITKDYYKENWYKRINRTIVPEGSYQRFKDYGFKNITEDGSKASYIFKIDKPGTILSYLPINEMHKIDSLTISGVLYEYDLGIIKKCHNMRYLDLHNAFVIKSPERYEQEKNSLTNFLTQAAALYLDIQSYLATGNSLGAFDYIEASIDKEYNKRFSNDFYLPEGLMKNHTNIETVILPIYTTKIPESAFSGCENLKNVIIPSALEEIGSGAFFNCKSMEDIVIPRCDYIRKEAFNSCHSLKNIIFKGKVKEFPKICYCESLQTLRFPEGLEKFGGIKNCTNLKDIYFPSTIKTISDIDNSSSELNLHFRNMKAPEVWRIERNKMNIIIPQGSITSYYRCFGEGCKYIEE